MTDTQRQYIALRCAEETLIAAGLEVDAASLWFSAKSIRAHMSREGVIEANREIEKQRNQNCIRVGIGE